MIIVSLSYVAPLEAVDTQINAHIAWLKKGYESGMFLASGRKVPRTGGVILARGEPEAVKAYCSQDPFALHDIAEYSFTETAFSMTAAGLEGLKD